MKVAVVAASGMTGTQLIEQALAALLCGRGDVIEMILRDRAKLLAQSGMTFFVQACRDVCAGRRDDPNAIRSRSPSSRTER